MSKISFINAAEYAGITLSQAKYWTKLLKLATVKESRNVFLMGGGEKILETMNAIIKGGASPSAAAKEILSVHASPIEKLSNNDNNSELTNRISSLEKAIMMLVEHNQTLKAENDAKNKFIVTSLRNIQLQLTPPVATQQIEVWKPKTPNRPKYSTIQRIWYEVTNPAKLRSN